MKLYELPLEADQIEEELHANLGELTPELEQRIAAFLSEGKAKIEAAATVVKSLESDAAVCKSEARRLSERSSRLERSAESLQNLMLFAVDHAFDGKVKTARFTIWGQNSAAQCYVTLKDGLDIHAVMSRHPEYIRAPEPELNLVALKDAIKAGDVLPEDFVIDRRDGTRYLRIK